MKFIQVGWKIALFVFSLTCSYVLQAQTFSRSDFKIALVGQFIKNIEWPEKSDTDPFVILVPQDKAMMATLSVLDGEKINNKNIRVIYAAELDKLPKAHLIYLSKNLNTDATNTLALTRGTGTLVVTENSKTLHNIMINIVDTADDNDETLQVKFLINRPNIVFEQLTIKPELILHGGSELDVADLYRETELAMQRMRDQHSTSQQLLNQQQQEILNQKKKLESLEANATDLAKQLKQNQLALTKQVQQLAQAEQKVEQVNLAKQTSEVQLQRASEKLEIAQNNIMANQRKVDEQVRLLSQLESQVIEKTQRLKEQQNKLSDTSKQLQAKSIEVESQAVVIDRQTQIITFIVISLLVFVALTAVITKLLFKNKKIAIALEQTLEELKNTHEQLIVSEKLASLGQLVAGVAHEINTPIGVVVTSSSAISDDAKQYLKMLEDKTLKRKNIEEFLNTLIATDSLIQSNLERCSTLIQNFKQISADQVVAENRTISLLDYLQEIMGALSVLLKRNKVRWLITGDNPSRNLDPGLLGQVINNLVSNAITHAFTNIEKREILIEINHLQEYDEIIFSDNGCGMKEATRLQIFDPFFTTKRGQGGTGLGMNIVYNLVTTKLNGEVKVDSFIGHGTKVTIKLPN